MYTEFSYCEALIECNEALNGYSRGARKSQSRHLTPMISLNHVSMARLAHPDRGSSWIPKSGLEKVLSVMYFEILTLSVLLPRWPFGAPYCILHTHMLISSKIGKSRVIFCGESSNLEVDCLLVPEGQHGKACMHPHRCPLKSLTGGSYGIPSRGRKTNR